MVNFKPMKRFYPPLIIAFLCLSISLNAQVAISNTNPVPVPDSTSILDLQSLDRGLLLPRMTTVERDNINNPAHSLLIFNTTTDCFEAYFSGGGWRTIQCNCNSYPPATFSISPAAPTGGNPVTFTPTYQGLGTYNWTFPNGSPSSSNSSIPTVTWSTTDTVSVSLTVTDSNGCQGAGSQMVQIINIPPIGNNTATFNNSSTGRSGSIQTWTVPPGVFNIQIEAWGAKGGGNLGGSGAYVKGDFLVTPGEVLNILVGQMGGITSQGTGNYCAGGGGGTFVYRNATDPFPLVAAAGGGGQAEEGPCQVAGPGGDGSGTTTPTNNGTTVTNGAGGTGGNGGSGGPDVPGAYSFSTGGGGCGWLTNGQDGLNLRNPPGIGGQAPRNGGVGGLFTHPNYNGADGGFGGGGGGSDNTGAGGGGGGWNGGGGGGDYIGSCSWGAGGGGGSYNGGANQTNQTGVRNTHGQVIITY